MSLYTKISHGLSSVVSFFKRQALRSWRKFSENKGYTHIYDDLVFLLTHGLSEVPFFWIFLILFLPLLLIAPLLFSEVWRQQLGLLYSLAIFFAFCFASFVLLAGLLVARNPSRPVLFIAARILTGVPKPYSKTWGLGYQDIYKLKQIANIEQASADWRGGVITILIITSVTILIGIPFSTWADFFIATNYGYELEMLGGVAGWPEQISGQPSWLMFAGLLVIFWSATNLFFYLVQFLSRETANRTVLFACVEAQSLLERMQLTDTIYFSLSQKRALAAHLGCRLIPWKTASLYDRLIGSSIEGMNDEMWLLIPPVKYSFDAQLASWWNTLMRHLKG